MHQHVEQIAHLFSLFPFTGQLQITLLRGFFVRCSLAGDQALPTKQQKRYIPGGNDRIIDEGQLKESTKPGCINRSGIESPALWSWKRRYPIGTSGSWAVALLSPSAAAIGSPIPEPSRPISKAPRVLLISGSAIGMRSGSRDLESQHGPETGWSPHNFLE